MPLRPLRPLRVQCVHRISCQTSGHSTLASSSRTLVDVPAPLRLSRPFYEPTSRPSSRMLQRRSNSTSSLPSAQSDPFTLLTPLLTHIRSNLLDMLGSGHPSLSEVTKYYFTHPSKQVRPVIVLLMAMATNGLGGGWEGKNKNAGLGPPINGEWGTDALAGLNALHRPLERADVLNDWNPHMPDLTARFTSSSFTPITSRTSSSSSTSGTTPPYAPTASPPPSPSARTPTLVNHLLPTQLLLAQIVEMLHTASLLHDDVIDASPLRRGALSAPAAFGGGSLGNFVSGSGGSPDAFDALAGGSSGLSKANGDKLSVLAGNFILGRASQALARLGDPEATELIASVLSNLVEGELLQLKKVKISSDSPTTSSKKQNDPVYKDVSKTLTHPRSPAWSLYLQKTYLKTASLMAKGARASVVLGGCNNDDINRTKDVAYAYGRNLGVAFQLIDDTLDYESLSTTLGKPGGADLQLGLATGPALFAWEEHPEIGPLILRKFSQPGDVEKAREMVGNSRGVERTKDLAKMYADKAREVLQELPESEARQMLEGLAERVVGRKK
ncbi:isoprenoid synthase domain-containing protein [Crepidotus variabilis]|uniref:(2E,6E)-farnesyl diphosphate synthase n=1 Tax=Crepidotus variabilis TaxID=179855 RepID=A0A9P6EDQ5_9AGAR|nr:isoprenoid synthase domain-containing protein [Crepidotus variabilis]